VSPKKNPPTKTTNPLHFEDLEPHRFEDLTRQLIYDFRNWQSIEATGRGGNDAGLDIRGWEKTQEITNEGEDDEGVGRHVMEGNLWIIQCKRERAIGPKKIKGILDNLAALEPPYGYILVAPVNFSKKSYDVFRENLRAMGVVEFYLWGKPELEDMLSLPKNDHVLFTFFGISFSVRKKSKTSEIKFQVNNKNKLLRILNDGEQSQNLHKSILIRDIKDEEYPWSEAYKDFGEFPRWVEHVTFGFHPRGLLFHVRKYYAFIDTKTKTFDFTEAVDLIRRHRDMEDRDEIKFETREKVLDFWKHLPRENQAEFHVERMIPYSNILVVDEKGDIKNNFPHLYVDFNNIDGPFTSQWDILVQGHQKLFLGKEKYNRVSVFPLDFPKIRTGKVFKDNPVEWDEQTRREFELNAGTKTLFDIDNKYDFLKARDYIMISGVKSNGEELYIEITNIQRAKLKDCLEENGGQYSRKLIERQVGRQVKDNEQITIMEFERTYKFALPK